MEKNSDESLKQFQEMLGQNRSLNLNAKVKVGQTVCTLLHAATLHNTLSDFSRLLLASGADPTITSNGQLPQASAAMQRRSDILEIYQAHVKGLKNTYPRTFAP